MIEQTSYEQELAVFTDQQALDDFTADETYVCFEEIEDSL